MVYIIFSDVHANLEAFNAVIASFPDHQEKEIICVGDIVGYGADPGKCLDMALSIGARSVKGNHDEASSSTGEIASFNQYAAEAAYWTRDRISGRDKEYLNGLGLILENNFFTAVHGTLHRPEAFFYMKDIAEAGRTFAILRTPVCFVGHSHVPGVYTLDNGKISYGRPERVSIEDGKKYIVNAGSVGQPRDGDNRACYSVYDTDKKEIVFHRVAYDIEKAQEKIIWAGLPPVLARRLYYGE